MEHVPSSAERVERADAEIRNLKRQHGEALDIERERQASHDKARTDETRQALDDARAFTASVVAALTLKYDERGALAPDAPSQALVTVGPRDKLKRLDIGSLVPDPMSGARHEMKRGRSAKGAPSVEVLRRGTAPVSGALDWQHDKLAHHTTGACRADDPSCQCRAGALALESSADAAEALMALALAPVRRLTLGASSLDVTRAADAILSALDVPELLGTDAVAWHDIEHAERVEREHDGADAMTVAILAGEWTDTLVSLSRWRCGITGGTLAPDAVHVIEHDEHEHDGRVTRIERVTRLSDIADTTAPHTEVQGWPASGARSARPSIPRWRASESDYFERVEPEHGAPYWRHIDRGAPVNIPATCAPVWRETTLGRRLAGWRLVPGVVFSAPERVVGRSARWTERVHIGRETFERGATRDGRKRASTRAERQHASAEHKRQRDDIERHEAPDAERVRAVLTLRDIEHDGAPVRFETERGWAQAKRQPSGVWNIRADGLTIGRPRSLAGAVALVTDALALD